MNWPTAFFGVVVVLVGGAIVIKMMETRQMRLRKEATQEMIGGLFAGVAGRRDGESGERPSFIGRGFHDIVETDQ